MGMNLIAKGYTIEGEEISTGICVNECVAKFTQENDLERYGWGNGYAIIHPTHPLYDVKYIPIDVHGGITYDKYIKDETWNGEFIREGRILGFDTAHCGDTPETMPESVVIEELKMFVFELENYYE